MFQFASVKQGNGEVYIKQNLFEKQIFIQIFKRAMLIVSCV